MTDNTKIVETQLAKLNSMNQAELEAKFEELYGFRAPRTKPQNLRARLAYRLQEIFLGGIAEEDMAVLEKVAAADPLSNLHVPKGRGRVPSLPGTKLCRIWKGVEHVVTVVGDGEFEYDGRKYTSLSRIAKVITGGHWNGKLFFGVK